MIRVASLMLALATLAACGADGPPTRPEPAPEPGLTVTGSAYVGVKVGG